MAICDFLSGICVAQVHYSSFSIMFCVKQSKKVGDSNQDGDSKSSCFCVKQSNKVGDCGNSNLGESFIIDYAHKLVHLTVGNFPKKLSATKETDSKGDEDIRVYLLKQKMADDHILILVVHCITLISAGFVIIIKMFWMNVVTDACRTDSNIHCFPQTMNESDSHLVSNISLQAPINDCSVWTNESFIGRITFLCFEFTHSVEGAIVALGGVLGLFKPTMNVIIYIAHKTYEEANKCNAKCNIALSYIQLIMGYVIGVFIEAFLVIGVVVLATIPVNEFFMNTIAGEVTMFFTRHGVVILFIFEIIHTSLLLPWDIYVNPNDYPGSEQAKGCC